MVSMKRAKAMLHREVVASVQASFPPPPSVQYAAAARSSRCNNCSLLLPFWNDPSVSSPSWFLRWSNAVPSCCGTRHTSPDRPARRPATRLPRPCLRSAALFSRVKGLAMAAVAGESFCATALARMHPGCPLSIRVGSGQRRKAEGSGSGSRLLAVGAQHDLHSRQYSTGTGHDRRWAGRGRQWWRLADDSSLGHSTSKQA